jgi:hypothetical protein
MAPGPASACSCPRSVEVRCCLHWLRCACCCSVAAAALSALSLSLSPQRTLHPRPLTSICPTGTATAEFNSDATNTLLHHASDIGVVLTPAQRNACKHPGVGVDTDTIEACYTSSSPGLSERDTRALAQQLVDTISARRGGGGASPYLGVSWYEDLSSFRVHLYDLLTKRQRHIGNYASEEDAARAYDCAAVLAQGPDTKRNFPGKDVSEAPETVGETRKQHNSSLPRCFLEQSSLFT